MFGLETLDILIGLATVYLLYSTACTAIVEAIMSCLKIRSGNLEKALNEFLNDKKIGEELSKDNEIVKEFFNHPLVYSLSQGNKGRPSYIPAEIVSSVVASIFHNKIAPEDSVAQKLFNTLWHEANQDIDAFRKLVENQFDNVMSRASGWFKRRVSLITFLVSVILVVSTNLDAISLTNTLAADPNARLKMVEIAQQQLDLAKEEEMLETDQQAVIKARQATVVARQKLDDAKKALESTGTKVQLGSAWSEQSLSTTGDIVKKIAGLLISIFAISLGAPFWFDVMQRFMKIRSTGGSTKKESPDKKE